MIDPNVLTEDVLKRAVSVRGGFSKKQLALIGVAWPPRSGWKRGVVGRSFPSEVLKAFIENKTT